MKNLGKNKVSKILNQKRNQLGVNNYYNYLLIKINKKTELNFIGNNLFIYILSCKDPKAIIKINKNYTSIKKENLFKIKKNKFDLVKIDLKGSASILFVYREKKTSSKKQPVSIKKVKDIYSVTKPWGYEQWLTGLKNKQFAFKRIFLKKGTKTSLQYHVKKVESNYLYKGKARLHYMNKNIPLIKNNFSKILKATKSNTINQGHVINVKPKTIHRLEAISNLILFEVSSPHLSDVVRVSDDSNRPDGKIKDEHKKKIA
tara:strand:+ start:204 stop:980 length:777 start_codon:yes stop_codon:yes gene_type:complete